MSVDGHKNLNAPCTPDSPVGPPRGGATLYGRLLWVRFCQGYDRRLGVSHGARKHAALLSLHHFPPGGHHQRADLQLVLPGAGLLMIGHRHQTRILGNPGHVKVSPPCH